MFERACDARSKTSASALRVGSNELARSVTSRGDRRSSPEGRNRHIFSELRDGLHDSQPLTARIVEGSGGCSSKKSSGQARHQPISSAKVCSSLVRDRPVQQYGMPRIQPSYNARDALNLTLFRA